MSSWVSDRRRVVVLCAAGAMLIAGCGDDSPSASTSTTTPPAVSSVTETTGEDLAASLDSATTVTADAGPSPTSGGSGTEIASLVELPPEQVCQLAPKSDVEAISGVAVGDPDGSNFAGLGTNCVYYGPGSFDLVAKIEFQSIDYGTAAGILRATAIGDVEAEDCEVAGKPAVCRAAYESNGIRFANVAVVQIGTVDDVPLYVESAVDLETARELAALVIGNLGLG